MKSMKLTVLWPQGTALLVRVRSGAKASELFDLLKFSVASGFRMYLLHEGSFLNPSKTLESQLISDGSTLIAGFVPVKEEVIREDPKNYVQNDLHDIYREALRINDLKYTMIDAHPNGGLMYQDLLKLDEEKDNFEAFKEKTTIPVVSCVQKEPLPVFWMSSASEDEEISLNESIKNWSW